MTAAAADTAVLFLLWWWLLSVRGSRITTTKQCSVDLKQKKREAGRTAAVVVKTFFLLFISSHRLYRRRIEQQQLKFADSACVRKSASEHFSQSAIKHNRTIWLAKSEPKNVRHVPSGGHLVADSQRQVRLPVLYFNVSLSLFSSDHDLHRLLLTY